MIIAQKVLNVIKAGFHRSRLICINMGESSKFQKSWTFEIQILKLAVCLQSVYNFKFKWSIVQRGTEKKSEKLLKSWIQE